MFRNSGNFIIIGALLFTGFFSLVKYSDNYSPEVVQPLMAGTSTPVISSTAVPTPLVESSSFTSLFQTNPSTDQALIAFIDAPAGSQTNPYVILTAYYSNGLSGGPIKIQGNLYDQTFQCESSPCKLPVSESSVIDFQGITDSGLNSNIVQAKFSIIQSGTQKTVTIESVSQFVFFTDACSAMWGTSSTNTQSWGNYVQSPIRLNTEKKLHLLASRLITFGIVDAKSCPGGGFDANGAPNVCGLEKALPAMIEWQNRFDFNIWAASRDIHIPPKVIKTLIETESQFWPSNERLFLDEIGLGQMNQLGMDIVLRNNPDIYFKLCPTVLGDCTRSYPALPKEFQAMIRGALIDSINASCPTCQYGLDFSKASQSIDLMGLVLKSTCEQTKTIVRGVRGRATNEDLWKFTIATYHSGVGCVQNAIDQAAAISKDLNWESVSKRLSCYGGKAYVDNFWNNLSTFDNYSLAPGNEYVSLSDAKLGTSQTLLPTPTVIVRNIHVLVNVFQDKNINGKLDTGEGLNNLVVQLSLDDGTTLETTTQNGKADFDMSNYRPGITIIASLPDYYQYRAVTLPVDGSITVDFVFTSPVP